MSDISFDEGTTSIDKDVNVGENVIVLAEIDAEETVTIVKEVKAADKKKVLAEIELNESDSEEEETQMLSGKDLNRTGSEQQGRQWYKPNWK